jgi:8-amino-7-oxononanoate synthase
VFPIVARGEDRVRLIMHAGNTDDEVRRLVSSILTWAEEMMEIEASDDKNRLPAAARRAYSLMKQMNAGSSA